jgi:hypothetical protein
MMLLSILLHCSRNCVFGYRVFIRLYTITFKYNFLFINNNRINTEFTKCNTTGTVDGFPLPDTPYWLQQILMKILNAFNTSNINL